MWQLSVHLFIRLFVRSFYVFSSSSTFRTVSSFSFRLFHSIRHLMVLFIVCLMRILRYTGLECSYCLLLLRVAVLFASFSAYALHSVHSDDMTRDVLRVCVCVCIYEKFNVNSLCVVFSLSSLLWLLLLFFIIFLSFCSLHSRLSEMLSV